MADLVHVVYHGGRFSKEIENRRSEVKSISFASSVDRISDLAFFCFTGITEIQIPPSVTSIGNQAFVGCTNLESIIIPRTISFIGDNAFLRCGKLRFVNLPPSLKSIGKAVFKKCTNLQSTNIPDGVESIGPHSFESCVSLKNLFVPESVKSIGQSAFDGCTSLSLVVSETPSQGCIGRCAFSGVLQVTLICSKMKDIDHSFGKSKPAIKIRAPEKPGDLLLAFFNAETPSKMLCNFYKLRISLGLEAVAKGTPKVRYQALRDKILSHCSNSPIATLMYNSLDDKLESMDKDTNNFTACIIGKSLVEIRCAIELALLGFEVIILEQCTTTELQYRSNMPQTVKWPSFDLAGLGVRTDFDMSTSRPTSRSCSNQLSSRSSVVVSRSNSNPVPVRSGNMRTLTLELLLMRIALVLGVRFIFGTASLSKELPVVRSHDFSGKRCKQSVSIDCSHGLKATMAEGNICREGLSKQDFFLANFGIAVRDGCSIEDIVNSSCFKKLLAINSHIVVESPASGVGRARGITGARATVRFPNTDMLTQSQVMSKRTLKRLNFIAPTSP